MIISLKWIKKYVDIDLSNPQKLALDFTIQVAEVEEVISQKEQYNNIITAKINKISKHEKADKLVICDVTDGLENYQIVTGANNISEGDIVPLAKIGSIIPSNKMQIKEAKLMGTNSFGMMCSEDELLLGPDSSGIFILPKDTPLGKNIAEIFDLDDVLIEIDNKSLTNRPDLWGLYGIAREFAAIYDLELKPLYTNKTDIENQESFISIDVKEPNACPAYMVSKFTNVKNTNSPKWLQDRLLSVGQRPISLLVDLTNYIMLLTGQPMHAFDYDKLNKSKKIIVRFAKDDEKVKTLDDQERTCNSQNLLICDEKNKPIAIAGVMGLENSECDSNTNTVLLEVANFDSAVIRKSALSLKHRTDSSNRFEKSLDPNFIYDGFNLFKNLILEICPESEFISYSNQDTSDKSIKEISISIDKINKSLGTDISEERILKILKSLSFEVDNNGGLLDIKVPSFRATKDIEIQADIIEEIGRVFGYNNIIPKAPKISLDIPHKMPTTDLIFDIKHFLADTQHLSEVNNYAFSSVEDEKDFVDFDKFLELENPIDKNQTILRSSLISAIINNVVLNQKNFNTFRLFEIEHVFNLDDNGNSFEPIEITGAIVEENVDDAIYQSRNVLLDLFNKFNINNIRIEPKHNIKFLHPYKSGVLKIKEDIIGYFGEINPSLLKKKGIKKTFSVFNTTVDIIEKYKKDFKHFENISKYPTTNFDLAFVVDNHVYCQEITDTIYKVNQDLITDIKPFDVYTGTGIEDGKKSIAFNILIQPQNRTLSSDEINQLLSDIVQTCENNGFILRK